MSRLAFSFTLMTVIPVLLIYLVALQFVGRSIESWFDAPVERALESGLNLGRATLDNLRNDLVSRARAMAADLAEQPPSQWSAGLLRLQEQNRVAEAMVVTGSGRVVTAGGNSARLFPDVPSAEVLRRVRLMRTFSEFDSGDNNSLKIRVITIVVGDAQRLEDNRYLQVIQPVRPTTVTPASSTAVGLVGSRSGICTPAVCAVGTSKQPKGIAMRKKSKYRPKGVRLDNMTWVMSSIKPFDSVAVAVDLRIKNHAALEALRTGQATRNDIDILIGAFNMCEDRKSVV